MRAPALSLLFLVCGIFPACATVGFDWAAVGDAGNAAKPVASHDADGTAVVLNIGAVGYNYQMATKEVTIAQYTEFLNSVDPGGANSLELYDSGMSSDPKGAGIDFSPSGAAGSKYSVIAGSGQHPVSYVGFDDAARFVNWLSNGQGSGDTESGVYAKTGTASGSVFSMVRDSAATVWVPTMDEWFKAAYYDPTLNSGAGGYWDYATQSDTAPSNDYATATGLNHANYSVSGGYTMSPGGFPSGNALTDAGAFTASLSYYGTYDQNGNVSEFIANTSDSETQFYYLGGGWSGISTNLNSDEVSHSKFGDSPLSFTGFRIASGVSTVPEVSASSLLLGLTCGLLFRRRRCGA